MFLYVLKGDPVRAIVLTIFLSPLIALGQAQEADFSIKSIPAPQAKSAAKVESEFCAASMRFKMLPKKSRRMSECRCYVTKNKNFEIECESAEISGKDVGLSKIGISVVKGVR